MDEIRVSFSHFWKDFSPDIFLKRFPFLSKKYKLITSDEPQIMFFSNFGNPQKLFGKKFEKKALKVFYYGENIGSPPIIDMCDFIIGSNRDLISNKYLYMPPYLPRLYHLERKQEDLIKEEIDISTIKKKKFCNFVYSHNVDRRNNFFKLLSKYKIVDSPARCMNNMAKIGKTYQDKMNFIKDYKFTIAFENSTCNGYLCEKISEPMMVNSIPIYWGDTHVHKHFNEKSFINCMGFKNDKEIIDYIIEIDRNKDLYRKMLIEPWFKNNKLPEDANMQKTEEFFERIFENVL